MTLPLKAFIFDMDGVVTNTADAHFWAWKEVFDDLLRRLPEAGQKSRPFTRKDYLAYVDGIPRYEGVRAFLVSRGIMLPEGDESDGGDDTVKGLGNRKNERFRGWLERNRIDVFDDALELIDVLRRNDVRVGIFSSSRNAKQVLESARVTELFDVAIDGAEAEESGLPMKPDPAMLIETVRRLGVESSQAAVIEDAVSGVEAGAVGRFSVVIGINRQENDSGAQRHALRSNGADFVVHDLRRLLVPNGTTLRTPDTLSSVWDCLRDVDDRISDRRLAIFLDYDGTLTPIISDYRRADLSRAMVDIIARLAERLPVAIITGRDLDDVRRRVGLDQVFYAGSHGFEIAGPGGLYARPGQIEQFIEPIDAAANELRGEIEGIKGAKVEQKTLAVAVHHREVSEEDRIRVEELVDRTVRRHAELRKGRGKMVFQVQPRIDWDKGRAVEWLLANTRLGKENALPLYIGDDITDEDAFAVLAGRGISLVVRNGQRITTADYALEDTEAVGRFLCWLIERIEEPKP